MALESLFEAHRPHGVYVPKDGTKVWVIAEDDRSATTVRWPEED